ncbi:MAG: hypothetical protein Q4P33_08165 [Flaviflexus sp.]|nr:hypothetical protein [Flaviflexus sp.]
MTDIDFDVRTFANLLETMPENRPMSDAMAGLEEEWYSSQREHMCSWFREQVGVEAETYTRKEPNLSARTTYQRLSDGPAMIWLAEVLGVDEELIASATTEVEAEPSTRRHCGIIRRYIPWELLAEPAAALIAERGITLEGADRDGIHDRADGEALSEKNVEASSEKSLKDSSEMSEDKAVAGASPSSVAAAREADTDSGNEAGTESAEGTGEGSGAGLGEESGPSAEGAATDSGPGSREGSADEAKERASRGAGASAATSAPAKHRAEHRSGHCSSCHDLWRAVSRLVRVTWSWFKDKTS